METQQCLLPKRQQWCLLNDIDVSISVPKKQNVDQRLVRLIDRLSVQMVQSRTDHKLPSKESALLTKGYGSRPRLTACTAHNWTSLVSFSVFSTLHSMVDDFEKLKIRWFDKKNDF